MGLTDDHNNDSGGVGPVDDKESFSSVDDYISVQLLVMEQIYFNDSK